LTSISENKCSPIKNATSGNCYLKDTEKQVIVWIAKINFATGLGLTNEDPINMIDDYVKNHKGDDLAVHVTMEITHFIQKNEITLVLFLLA